MTNRTRLAAVLLALLALVAGQPAAAPAAPPPAAAPLPDTLALPNGFLPEGIAIGRLPFAFFGSRADGSLFRVDLLTGRGQVFSQGPGAGHPSVGLKVDDQLRLFVSGGTAG